MPFTMAVFVQVASYFSWLATSAALVFNFVLTHLVKTASPHSFGNYPKLMYANSFNLIFFSLIHAFAQPIISIEKTVVYVFCGKNYLHMSDFAMRLIISAYGVTYCMSVVLCAVTFVFRYNTVCKTSLDLFSGTKQMCCWFLFVAFVGVFWGLCIFYLAANTEYVDSIIAQPLLHSYGFDIENVTYVAAVYEIKDQVTGMVTMNQKSVFMGFSFATIIGSSMLVTAFCVYQIARKTAEFKDTTIFEPIQKQLFYAQCVQMAIPFSLACIPIFGVLVFPLFRFDGNVAFSVASILISIYPVIDPIAMTCLITQYRNALCGKGRDYPNTYA